ncbi:MAG: hypothetical protein JSW58_03075 [Candidatus Latescibacterota bacterium]|nr:MAG: hypothetical protein JSW58_03075 [Candidatus Latescibacterota bacterium]
MLSVFGFALVGSAPMTVYAASEDGILEVQLANGVDARVFTADYLAERTRIDGARGVLELDNGQYFTLITDINDPLIQNKGDGRFHPLDNDLVVDRLSQIGYPNIDLEVEVYVLPFPRANVLSSSASGRRIYLSPQVLEISTEGAAYIIAHEMGHVFQYRYLPDSSHRRWDEYRKIRGIEDRNKFSESSAHAYRPREIFAEDFRVLFGGSAAFFGGRVENPELESPLAVTGLRQFFLGLTTGVSGEPIIVSFVGYPNPFNPQTELRVRVSDDFVASGEQLTVTVYDVTGALVRELYKGRPSGADVRVGWDGRDRHGRQVASSTYFGVVKAGNSRMTTKLLMIK